MTSGGSGVMRCAALAMVLALVALVVAHGFAGMTAPLTFADIARPRRGEWPTYHGNLSGNRFSPLHQIDAATIHRLAAKWMFTIQGAPRPLQMTPVVVDGVMYVTSVNGNRLWEFTTNQTWKAGPMTYSVDGDQYIAVAGGSNIFAFSLR